MDSDVRNLRRLCAFVSSVLPFDPYLVRMHDAQFMHTQLSWSKWSDDRECACNAQLHTASLSSAELHMSHYVVLPGQNWLPLSGDP